MQPGLGRSVPETREVGIAAPTRGERQRTTPAAREQARRREERSGEEPLETPATAFEAELGATSCDGAAGPFPGEGRRERRGAGPKEAIVAYRRDADVDGPGGLRGGGARGQEGRCRGEGRGPSMSRGRRGPHGVRGGRGAAGGPPRSLACPRPSPQPQSARGGVRPSGCRGRRRAGLRRGPRLL